MAYVSFVLSFCFLVTVLFYIQPVNADASSGGCVVKSCVLSGQMCVCCLETTGEFPCSKCGDFDCDAPGEN